MSYQWISLVMSLYILDQSSYELVQKLHARESSRDGSIACVKAYKYGYSVQNMHADTKRVFL